MPVLSPLAGTVRGDGERVVITLVGEIDIATLPQLRTLVDEALAVGVLDVTVDMAGVEFLDASGLGVLVGAAERLRATGGRLAVRAVPRPVYRIFDVTGLADTLSVQRPADASPLVRGLAGVAMLPLSRDVLDAALKLVTTMAQAVVVGADGVSITLPRNGRLGTVAASNDVVLEMDHDQYDTNEGPCLDAATLGERSHIDSLREEARWPAFVPRARARGIESILSTPLVTSSRPIGALNVYSRTVGAFAVHEQQWMDQFAVEAATVVSSADQHPSGETLHARIEQALLSREVIACAQGMVMHRDGVAAAAAHDLLRDASRRTGRPLRDICEELVRSHGPAGD